MRPRSGEGVGEGGPGRGAVPVGLSAMSIADPQAGQAVSTGVTGAAQVGQAYKGSPGILSG